MPRAKKPDDAELMVADLAAVSSALSFPGSVVGVGLDLISPERFEKLLGRGVSLEKIFSPTEIADSGGSSERLAARWAGKEAVMKALGLGIGQCRMRDIEIILVGNAPEVTLYGEAAIAGAAAGVSRVMVSLSHERVAAAFAVAVRADSSVGVSLA